MQTERAFLIVDDDADVLKAAGMALSGAGTRVDLASSPEALDEKVKARAYDALLLDMNFALGDRSGRDGLDWLARVQEVDPALSVVLMTTYGGVALAVETLKRGAFDFVLKPWRNETLAATLESATATTRRRRDDAAMLNLDDLERRAIERALALHEGNISHAAAALGLTRPALYRRMARHGL
jgi:DNA-binding NtrC family response regulator